MLIYSDITDRKAPSLEAILGRLQDGGKQMLRGRSEPVRIWISRPAVPKADR